MIALFTAASGVVVSCADELNPYTADEKIKKPKTDVSSTSTDPTSSSPTETNSGPSTTTPTDVATTAEIDTLFNEACKEAAGINVSYDISWELGYLCTNGASNGKFRELMKYAYSGAGEPATIAPIKNVANGNESEAAFFGAIKLGKEISQINSKIDAVNSLAVEGGGVTLAYSIIQKLTPQTPEFASYALNQNIKTTVGIISMNDDIRLLDHWLTYENPKISFNIRHIKSGESVNSDNRIDTQISVFIQTEAAVTYAFSVMHITVDNKGLPDVAKSKLAAQPPIVTKKLYSVIMGG